VDVVRDINVCRLTLGTEGKPVLKWIVVKPAADSVVGLFFVTVDRVGTSNTNTNTLYA
jgi:hypothetical protein